MHDEFLSPHGDDFVAHLVDELSVAVEYSPPAPHWSEKYQYDLYDWNDPWFKQSNTGKNSYRAIPLTRGYFMVVDPRDYKQMTQYPDGSLKRWYVTIKRDPDGSFVSLYAHRRGRGDEPKSVPAHREILDCIYESGEGDHVNGEGLDNRRKNLLYVPHGQNLHNCVRNRSVHLGLPRGVVKVGTNAKGQQLYGGQRCVRVSRKKVVTFRTKRTWLSPEPAAQWYQNQLKRLYNRDTWAHEPKSVTYFVPPPLMESEPVPFPIKGHLRIVSHHEAIPF